ncbi:MAG TPA: hypothetical protein V6C69_00075 [Trichormus sp.]
MFGASNRADFLFAVKVHATASAAKDGGANPERRHPILAGIV